MENTPNELNKELEIYKGYYIYQGPFTCDAIKMGQTENPYIVAKTIEALKEKIDQL